MRGRREGASLVAAELHYNVCEDKERSTEIATEHWHSVPFSAIHQGLSRSYITGGNFLWVGIWERVMTLIAFIGHILSQKSLMLND